VIYPDGSWGSGSRPKTYADLQPPYDPTNGITSKGNLYLIFPQP